MSIGPKNLIVCSKPGGYEYETAHLEMEPTSRGVEDKWHELLTPPYESQDEMSYLGNADSQPPPTPTDPTNVPVSSVLDTPPGFTGPQYSWSFNSFIHGDNVMNMGFRTQLHQGHVQPSQLNIGPAGDATNQYMNNQQSITYEWPVNDANAPTPLYINNQHLAFEWPVNEPNAPTMHYMNNQHLPYEWHVNELNAPTHLHAQYINNQHLPLEWPVSDPNAPAPLVRIHAMNKAHLKQRNYKCVK
ncbi:uncharacterized protein LOC130922608 isoform X2 [Corythoichthys intestinalis]|uniref:uncharacterized protein LOC130922608 isoform X2 n=1 Tax=Corythoichthys intestinalis TaxID=161448 RepID=UPI0025A5ECF9|nr:uncharacterized protein LOC130922608 isoform X2 [Corythoichthys intestinalis]